MATSNSSVNKKVLGKGLGALIPQGSVFTGGRTIVNVDIGQIIPNPRQPRTEFIEETIIDLADSIKSQGVIEPILARMRDGKYELVAGERRFRAAKKAGLSVIPTIIKDFSDEESLAISLIENLQREDLNPMDEAEGYQRLAEEFKLTQADIAKRVGKSRSTVTNILRLLELPTEIQNALRAKKISEGHARPLLSLSSTQEQLDIFKEIIKNRLSVRDVEQLISGGKEEKKPSALGEKKGGRKRKFTQNAELNDIVELLTNHLATKVRVYGNQNKGKIEIEYYSREDLERLIELITGGTI